MAQIHGEVLVNDKLCINDSVLSHNHHQGLWAKTQIIGGYGLHKNKYGVSELDEVVFDTSNMVPIGGVQFAMEMIFGVKSQWTIPNLDGDSMPDGSVHLGSHESDIPTITTTGMPYPYGQRVCLFGVGYGAAAENTISVKEVKYNEYSIESMVPFQYTDALNIGPVNNKYFGRKKINNMTAYYLKAFDDEPIIYNVYKNSTDDAEGSEPHKTNWVNESNSAIETYTECQLTISQDDVRAWFNVNRIDTPRINSVGLYSAVWSPSLHDYVNIRLFSKFNIPTEPLLYEKSMTLLYRVYGS